MTHTNHNAPLQQMQTYYHYWSEMNRAYENWAKLHGISYNAMNVLYSLWENPTSCTQGTICRQWMLPKQTVNTILKDFEKKGYIRFVNALPDGRKKQIHLTKTGTFYAENIIPKLQQLEVRVISDMGKEQTEAFLNTTAQFVNYFKLYMEEDLNHE